MISLGEGEPDVDQEMDGLHQTIPNYATTNPVYMASKWDMWATTFREIVKLLWFHDPKINADMNTH